MTTCLSIKQSKCLAKQILALLSLANKTDDNMKMQSMINTVLNTSDDSFCHHESRVEDTMDQPFKNNANSQVG